MSRCCPHLEALFINGEPFYSPRECSFILASVYMPPQACVREALQRLANQITSMEQEQPDSLLIIQGGFQQSKPQSSTVQIQAVYEVLLPGTETHCHTVLMLPHAAFKSSDHSSFSNLQTKTKIQRKPLVSIADRQASDLIGLTDTITLQYCGPVGCGLLNVVD